LAADGDGTTEKNDQIQARAAQAASAEAQGRARPCRRPHRARLGPRRSVREQGTLQGLRPIWLAELRSHLAPVEQDFNARLSLAQKTSCTDNYVLTCLMNRSGGFSPHWLLNPSSADSRLLPLFALSRSVSAQRSCTRPHGSAQ